MSVPRRRMLVDLARRGVALVAAVATRSPALSRDFGPGALRRRDIAGRARWIRQHDGFVAESRRGRFACVMLGDSLTYGWTVTARELYRSELLARGIRAFGIGGDRTEDLRWRIEHGELAGPSPRLVVVMIGTNDLDSEPAAAVARGIAACVKAVRLAAPSARILLLGVIPRGPGGRTAPKRVEIEAVNEGIAHLDDGDLVNYLDIGAAFLRPDGSVDPTLFEPDLVHLGPEGYAAWRRAMEPALDRLLR